MLLLEALFQFVLSVTALAGWVGCAYCSWQAVSIPGNDIWGERGVVVGVFAGLFSLAAGWRQN